MQEKRMSLEKRVEEGIGDIAAEFWGWRG